MSLLQAYLRNPKTKHILSRRPGDKGFSLIELVVVVAVLAILAAVAIPQFTSINDKAAVAAAQNSLAQIVKECAVKKANMESETFLVPKLAAYTITEPAANATTNLATCAGNANSQIVMTASNDPVLDAAGNPTIDADGKVIVSFANTLIPQTIQINVLTGEKTCAAGAADTTGKFCDGGRW